MFPSHDRLGYKKYGSTLDDERRFKMKDLYGYLTDIQEELMDAILYIQTAREEIEDLKNGRPFDNNLASDYDNEEEN